MKKTFPRLGVRVALGLIAALLQPAVAQSAVYCSDDTSELLLSLASAAQSAEDDEVRIRSGTFNLAGDIDLVFNGGLRISGGWNSGCTSSNNLVSLTVLSNTVPGAFRIVLRPRDNLTVERLTFDRIDRLLIQDVGSSPSVNSGIVLRRNRFITNDAGPLIRPRDSSVRVENNLITGSLARSFALDRTDATAPFFAADIQNNTMVGGSEGADITGTAGSVVFRNNVMYGGATDGRLLILDGTVAVDHNRVGAIGTQNGGSASPASQNLIGVDPLLDANFVPRADSPLVNTGTNIVNGGLASIDHFGNPRRIGSRADRGAGESPFSDTTTVLVTSSANSGAGTLRQAIIDANFASGEQAIEFAIPGACPRSITLTSPLPPINTSMTLDGFTQPGASPNSNAESDPDGDNGVHCVALFGDGSGILIVQPNTGEEVTVRGLAFYRASDSQISVNGNGRATIVGNVFNTGTSFFETQVPPVAIKVFNAPGTRIGGFDVADRNIIGRASVAGIQLQAGSDRTVEGNWIGIGRSGASNNGNGVGIHVTDGRLDAIDGNVIGNSATQGLRVDGALSSVSIRRNLFGRSPNTAGASALTPNGGNAVRLIAGDGFVLKDNRIVGNSTDGVAVLAGVKNAELSGNEISANSGLGIDLSPDGVNPIDTDTGATGANNGQNFPELFGAFGNQQSGIVQGQLRSANGDYLVTFYRSASCDNSGHGEGFELVGSVTVTIDNGTSSADGSVDFNATITADNNMIDDEITAIADRLGPVARSSSEFSRCISYVVDELLVDGFEP